MNPSVDPTKMLPPGISTKEKTFAWNAPLAVRSGQRVMPPLASQFIEIVKNSAAAMLLGIKELTFQTQNIDVETFRGFEAATAVTLIYLALALTISGAMTYLGNRIKWR